MSPTKKIQVCLILDSLHLPNWQYSLIERIHQSDYADISLILLNENPSSTGDYNLSKSGFYRFYKRLESLKSKKPNTAQRIMDVTDLLTGVQIVKLEINNQGIIKSIDSVVTELRRVSPEVTIQLGQGNFDAISNESVYGTWKLVHHHPVGFWEVLKHHIQVKSSLTINKHQQKDTIFESYSPVVPFSVTATAENKYWRSAFHIPRMLEVFHQYGEDRFFEIYTAIDNNNNSTYKNPRRIDLMLLILDFLYKYVKEKILGRLFHEKWILLYDFRERFSSKFSNFKKLVPPKGRFWADPFIVFRDNKYYIFLEESLSGRKKKGFISVMSLDLKGNFEPPKKILEKPYHMSYPFVFNYENEWYMIPESNASSSIDLYKCNDFPHSWVFHKHLMKDVIAVDSTLLFYNNKWWLFANMKDPKGGSTWDELFLFYADSPLSNDWVSHPKNPIVSDVRRARPAGNIFERNGNLYRPAQDCSVRYGYALIIHRIECLTEDCYREVITESYLPNWDSTIKGIHTLNRVGNLTMIDGTLRNFKLRP